MQGWLSWECYCIFQWVWLGKGVNWWGTEGEHCDLAVCPTEGNSVDGFVFFFFFVIKHITLGTTWTT